MDIKEFVQTAVTQIVEGVVAAQAAASRHGAAVNPAFKLHDKPGHSHIGITSAGAKVTNVTFDIAVTATESTGARGGAKVQVAGLFSVGGGADTNVKAEQVTRLQFSVPICLPEDQATRPAADEETRKLDTEFQQPLEHLDDSTWMKP